MTISYNAAAQGLERILSELADSCPMERARLEAAARILTAARRATGLHLPATDATRAVAEILRHWDTEAVTALEYAETLPEAALDRLLRAAPAWAAAARRAVAHGAPRGCGTARRGCARRAHPVVLQPLCGDCRPL